MTARQPSALSVPAEVMDLESTLTRVSYLMARAKQHHSIAAEASVGCS